MSSSRVVSVAPVAVGREIVVLLATIVSLAGVAPAKAQRAAEGVARPKFTAAQREALMALSEQGGILLQLDERRSGEPLIRVDFAGHAEFEDDWLKHLLPFDELATIGLSGTRLTDAGIAHLVRLPKLAELNLRGTAVTDVGVAGLAACTQLRKLDLRETRASTTAVAQLRKALPRLEVTIDSAADAKSSGAASARFSAKEIRQWREKLVEMSALPEGTPDGWSKSRIEPARLLTLFPKLSLRKGYVLRAYVFKEEGNSNGFVWALPDEAAFPAPNECPRVEWHFLHPPKPFDALDDFMEVIQGDDSLESYLQASILRRELKEFGCGWHGVKWGMHTVLDDNPWKGSPPVHHEGPSHDRPESKPDQWKWLASQPATWAPEVRREQERVVVTFYSYTAFAAERDNGEIEKERILQHTETYRRGKYRPLVVEKKLAQGPNALVH